MADRQREAGDELASLAHLIAAQTLENPGQAPTALLNVATGYFTKGDHEAALYWYGLLLRLDPGIASAHQNLAAIHSARGDEAQADLSRERAYRLQRVFIEDWPDARRRLLILCTGRTAGNIPYEALLSRSPSTRIKYVIDFADPAEDAQLPPHDGVFNAIGEPDVAVQLGERLRAFVEQSRVPLLNPPQAVERTRRHQLPALLDGLAGVETAPCQRFEAPAASLADLAHRLAQSDIALPALIRPVASHGGAGLQRCETLEELAMAAETIGGAHYLTSCIDARSADGFYRKYRIVFIGGEPHAYHLAISPNWMVHYFSADMLAHDWKLEEDRRFTEDPAGVLGEEKMAAIRAIGGRLMLDYAGIDFTLLPDGRILVFEANATMLVHGERGKGPLAFRNAAIQRMAEAFERMLQVRIGSLADMR